MWLGLLHLSPGEACDGEETVVLLAWKAGRERPLTVGGPIAAVAQLARLLRKAAEQAPLRPPRCDACGMPFDLPLD
jgi:predicted Zn-ribbon and HTH transcriptional regulator